MIWYLDLFLKYDMKEKYNFRERGLVLGEKIRWEFEIILIIIYFWIIDNK